MRPIVHAAVALLALSACSDGVDFDLGGNLSPVPFGGKDDGTGQASIRVDADVHDTEVWKVRNQWTDVDTTEARRAGIAWPANSGLNWDQKFAAWVKAMPKVKTQNGYWSSDTYELITPFGKTAPSPALECAETAMFLRATFASWYGLPFIMEAWDRDSGRVFFGHFGVRTTQGRWRGSPRYPNYDDHTGSWQPGDDWPQDSKLRTVHLDGGPLAGAADVQLALGPDVHFGAYLDEIYLNKRAGYFVAYLLDYFFSGDLSDGVNAYNLKPEAIREGDFVLHRTNRDGIGHTLNVKNVTPFGTDQLIVELVAGSMPRIQGDWKDEVQSKMEIVEDSAGGVGNSSDQPVVPVWKLGGGLKRWRVARNVNGWWTNTFMPGDKPNWISSNDPALGDRPKRFETLLAEIPPPQKRDALLKIIDDSRQGLLRNPSSCSSRANREDAFRKLTDLAYDLQTTAEDMQRQYRTLADGVFAELTYAESKTCCWDHSSPQMGKIIMDFAAEEEAAATAQNMCVNPTVFRANATVPQGYDGPIDGYQLWRDWAKKKGRSDEWVDSDGKPAVWRKDEPCQGEAVQEDAISYGDDTDYCSLVAQPPSPPMDLAPGDPDAGAPADMGL